MNVNKLQLIRKIYLLALIGLITLPLSAQKRFSKLPASKTGIDFNNQIKDTREQNILIYSNFYGGAGVGIGDFDNDGLQDVFFAGNLVPDRLYINQGDLKFKDASKSSNIIQDDAWSTGVVLADINSDGWLDIYVTRELYDDQPERRRNLLYINQGKTGKNGEVIFKESAKAWGIEDTARTRHASFIDYDRDGDLDLFLLNQPPNPGNYSPLKNTNLKAEPYRQKFYRQDNGVFTDVTKEVGLFDPGFGNSLSTSDFNQDGWPDIYVANDFDEPDRLYLNRKDGTFVNIIDESMRHISFYSMGVDAADINNDGLLDISVLDMVAEDNYRSKANMSGMNPKAFWKVVKDGGHFQYMYNSLQLNQGFGDAASPLPYFSDIGQLTGISKTDWSWSNLIADFDNDGLKDIYITNGLMRDIRNKDSEKTFIKYVTKQINEFIVSNPDKMDVTIWDVINLDAALSTIPSERLPNYMFQNQGDLKFNKVAEDWGLEDATFSNGSAYGDLDNDGDLDLIISNINDEAFVYRNNSSSQTQNRYLRVKLPKEQQLFGSKAEIRHQGTKQFQELTNVRGIYSTSEFVFHFGVGTLEKIDSLIITDPNGNQSILTDIPTNQEITLESSFESPLLKASSPSMVFKETTQEINLEVLHLENSYDDFTREVLLPHKMSNWGPALATGDVNGDLLTDFYLGGAIGLTGKLMLQQANGSFIESEKKPWKIHRGFEDTGATFFDADGDGDLDLYTVSGGNEHSMTSGGYQDRLYVNDGNGEFKNVASPLPMMAASGSNVIPADFDKDGDLDLLVCGRQNPGKYPMAGTTFLLRNDTETADQPKFVNITKEIAPGIESIGMVTDAAWSDINQDGQLDMILVGEWMPITIFTQNNGSFSKLKTPQLNKTDGWWFSIEGKDIDNDGDEDFIIGNLGENYKYSASKKEPFSIYYDDFDENGKKDIVLGYYQGEELFPLRGRECSSQQVPEIKNNFPTYNDFAQATLAEVYGEINLNQSIQYNAYTFSSIYLENLGKGKFAIHQLPVDAQLSTINDIVIDDIDQDGHDDLVVAGNLYASEVETPRADAGLGLWLRGNGQGDFTAVPPYKSGLYLPYDVKNIAIINGPQQSKTLLVAPNQQFVRTIQIIQKTN